MTDMKKAEELEIVKVTMEHIHHMREKREEIVYVYDDGGPVLWVSSGAEDTQTVTNNLRRILI